MEKDKNNLEQMKELNTQYKVLRKNGIVYEVSLRTPVGDYSVLNQNIIPKILDLLIHESQKQIEREIKDE